MAIFVPSKCYPKSGGSSDWAKWFCGNACERAYLAFRVDNNFTQESAVDVTFDGVTERGKTVLPGYVGDTCSGTPSGYFKRVPTNAGSGYAIGLDVFKARDDSVWTSSTTIDVKFYGMNTGFYQGIRVFLVTDSGAFSTSWALSHIVSGGSPAATSPICSYSGSEWFSKTVTIYDDGSGTIT